MIYSVYDYPQRVYDYYEGTGGFPASGFMRGGKGGDLVPEKLLAVLPADAQHIGSGKSARGVIATVSRHPGALGTTEQVSTTSSPSSSLAWLGLAVAVGAAFYAGRKSVSVEAAVRRRLK